MMKNQIFLYFLIILLHETSFGSCKPFFGPFRRTTPPPKQVLPEQREPRIINADHGGLGAASPSAASFAGGNVNVAPAPWIPGSRDQYILDQLVILHPDSPLNRDAWRESGLLNYEYKINHNDGRNPEGSTVPPVSTTPTPSSSLPSPSAQRVRKPHRKAKHHQHVEAQDEAVQGLGPQNQDEQGRGVGSSPGNNFLSQATLIPSSGGIFDLHQPQPPFLFRDLNNESEDAPSYPSYDPFMFPANSLHYPVAYPAFPFQPRATSQPLPPEAVIQLLKSPEQELSPYSRPQVKLPFPLSHDCSSGAGGSGSKPLQFVVLPIVEPVAPLKPLITKPSFLTSQYGHFPYIPPFNLFKKPPVPSLESLNGGASNSGGSSGQFVPILNRPAPPLPFVFVQSLPLELIGQNTEMDVIHAPASSTNTETKIKEVPPSSPVSAPTPSPTPPSPTENGRPLPLIVIEKVKTPGQPPSSPIAPAAAVVEISKQSIQKNSNGGSPPLSTISVVQPITPGPTTPQKQQEIQKAIEKLVPVAAAVLENVELEQQKQQQKGQTNNNNEREREAESSPVPSSPLVGSNPAQNPPPIAPTRESENAKLNEQQKLPLRAPLRPGPDSTKDGGNNHKKPDVSSSEEAGVNPTTLREVEVMEA